MLISYHWLKKFVNLKASPQEIADKITLNLVEVESITKKGEDTIFEIENKGITNRPDGFSQLGLAREIAAYFHLELKDPLPRLSKLKFKTTKELPFKVEIKEPGLCFRYTSLVLNNIKVKPSPQWLRTGVENCGVRSVNNVVDITNYVMLELGQPLHAFDYQKVKNHQIIVRKAKMGEKIETFEGERLSLNPENLVIADSATPVALAGIIGGKKTEITSQTRTIILESANFEKTNNRRTEKSLKIRTEASTRFEKGLDVNLTLPALNRAVGLLKDLASAKIASPRTDLQSQKTQPKEIKISPEWINRFLGLNLKPAKMVMILQRLQLKATLRKNNLVVTVPTFRSDLNLPADIAEEIARIYSYDKIPITLPTSATLPPRKNNEVELRKKVKKLLQSTGFSEVLTQPFLSPTSLITFNLKPGKHLKLINPLTTEQEYLRRSLIPSLTIVIKKNLKNFSSFRLFEIDKIFIPQKGKKAPVEVASLTMAAVGINSYPILKGSLEILFECLGIEVNFKPKKKLCFWQNNQIATITNTKDQRLGTAGKIKKRILLSLEIEADLSLAELNFSRLVKLAKPIKIFRMIPQYPPIIEDLSFILQPQTPIGEIIQLIKKIDLIIKRVELVSSYQNTRTLRITYQSPRKTLTDQEVGKVRKKIIMRVRKRFNAEIKQ